MHIDHVSDYHVGMEDRLLPAPLNSVRPPPGKDRKDGHPAAYMHLVVARLVWPRSVQIVPGMLKWVSSDRVLVEWGSAGRLRQTWLPACDVRRALTYR